MVSTHSHIGEGRKSYIFPHSFESQNKFFWPCDGIRVPKAFLSLTGKDFYGMMDIRQYLVSQGNPSQEVFLLDLQGDQEIHISFHKGSSC